MCVYSLSNFICIWNNENTFKKRKKLIEVRTKSFDFEILQKKSIFFSFFTRPNINKLFKTNYLELEIF